MAAGSVSVEVKPDFTNLIEGLRRVAAAFEELGFDAHKAADELENREDDERG
ncbi:hypothetical protein SEA_YECEY3_43 [Mycobacterium phage Yecey3]|uniref:Uncharacterized protein n=1 Tax=Mycobacterium phage Yecey3 TaxID=2656617 RepID=A0A649V9W5_9CAUD|nr:hypothetical protein KIV58_gp066 [Mycobacterium phage Yecey3]QGJ88795.1 hypothetical protein SEA_YECEY3_43 [Mycobacterium phage Yecey3]